MKFFATVILFFSVLPFSKADISTQIIEKEYAFSASSIEEMLTHVRNHGPKVTGIDTWASLQAEIDAKYGVISDDNGCQFYQPKVDVKAVMTLPNWQNISTLATETHQWWRGYMTYLSKHELEHLAIVKKAALKLLSRLKQPHKGLDCTALRKRYFSYKIEMLTEIRLKDNEFDRVSSKELVHNDMLFSPLSPYMTHKIEFKKPVLKSSFDEKIEELLGDGFKR